MKILCLVPIGMLIARGYFYPHTLLRLRLGEINPMYGLCRN